MHKNNPTFSLKRMGEKWRFSLTSLIEHGITKVTKPLPPTAETEKTGAMLQGKESL